MKKAKLSSISDLLSATFQMFKDRLVGAFLISIIPGIAIYIARLAFLPSVKSIYLSSSTVPSLSTILLTFVLLSLFVSLIILHAWSTVSLYTSLFSPKKISLLEAFEISRKNIVPFLVLAVLLICIVSGGLILFIIPMLVFINWFSFSQFLLITENEKGFRAIMKSREYVRGYFWEVFGRNALGSMIYFFVFMILIGLASFFKISSDTVLSKIIFYLIQVIGTIFNFCFSFQVLRDLKRIKGNVETKATRKSIFIFTTIALIGLLLAITIFVGSFYQYLF